MEIVSKALDFIAKYAWAVFLTDVFVLLLPKDVAVQLGILEIREQYKGFLWIALVLTLILSVGAAFQYFDKRFLEDWLKDRRAARIRQEEQWDEARRKQEADNRREAEQVAKAAKKEETLKLRLDSLNVNERWWIKYCLYHNASTLTAQQGDSTAQSLTNKGLLIQGSGHMFDLPFHIPDHVWEYLLRNREQFLSDSEQQHPRTRANLDAFRNSLRR